MHYVRHGEEKEWEEDSDVQRGKDDLWTAP